MTTWLPKTRGLGLALTLAVTLGLATGGSARAQSDYPSKPIIVLMPGTAGGSFDRMTRLVMSRLAERLKTSIVVQNVVGAGGTIAADRGARAEPDGYTLTMGYFGNIAAAPWLFQKLPYDPVKDLRPVVPVGSVSYVLAVPASSPIMSFDDLVKTARARPGKLNFASSGNGTGGHIGGELLKSAARLDMVHVPYQSAAPASVALLAGEVDWAFEALPTGVPNVKAGKLRALAVSTPKRFPGLPDVPTVAELGYPGFEVQGWLGVMAPAKTPDAIVGKLNAEINEVLKSPEVLASFAESGADAMGGTQAAFEKFVVAEIEKYGEIIRRSKAKAD